MTPAVSMAGARVLVIGASSGLGASFAVAAAEAGAAVAVSARRVDRLEALARRCGALALPGDTTVAADIASVAATAADAFGGIDLLLYAAGYGVLQPIDQTQPDLWVDLYRVNALGASLATAAVLAHMDETRGLCAYLSSRAPGDVSALFGPYTASKAALDQCIRTWRVEHPARRFTRVVMGNCFPTEFGDHMGSDLLVPALEAWGRQAIPGGFMHVDDAARALARLLAVPLADPTVDLPELHLDARPFTEGSTP